MYFYFNNCVNWNRADVHEEGGLCDMIDRAVDISRRTFLKHIDKGGLDIISVNLGYSLHHKQGLLMSQDLYVSYHRSMLHGVRVYYFRHSAIEYVFTKGGK